MAFGAGVLISAVAYELVGEAFDTSAGSGGVALGLFAGALTFFVGDTLIDRMGGGDRKRSGGQQAAGSALAIVLGIVLDGIPETAVIGLSLESGGVSAAVIAAVFLSNLPEAIAATTGLVAARWPRRRILGLWVLVIGSVRPVRSRRLWTPHRRFAAHGCIRARVRGRRPAHDARGHDDAGGVREGRQARRACHDSSGSRWHSGSRRWSERALPCVGLCRGGCRRRNTCRRLPGLGDPVPADHLGQRLDHIGIELETGVAGELLERFIACHRATVRAVDVIAWKASQAAMILDPSGISSPDFPSGSPARRSARARSGRAWRRRSARARCSGFALRRSCADEGTPTRWRRAVRPSRAPSPEPPLADVV